MSFSLSFLTVFFTTITVIAFNLNNLNCNAETIFERFRQNSSSIEASSALVNDGQVKFVSGTKVKLLPLQLGGTARLLQPVQPIYNYVRPHYVYFPYFRQNFITGWPYYHPLPLAPQWQAGAKLTGEGIDGVITFQQLPYNNDIKVTLNATGLPVGKHALHIHTYGDLNDGCKSTGGQFPNNFLGNIVVKESGEVNVAFISVYLTLFGYNGIIGRSIVIHEQPIDLNNVLNADIFSTTLHAVHDVQAFQNEENSVGAIIACGVISIMAIPAVEK